MVVGVCKCELYLPACHSLKDKRRVLRKLKDRAANRFHVQIAEVDHQDVWQRSMLGFAVVGNDRRVLQSLVDRLLGFIETNGDVRIVDQYSEVMNV